MQSSLMNDQLRKSKFISITDRVWSSCSTKEIEKRIREYDDFDEQDVDHDFGAFITSAGDQVCWSIENGHIRAMLVEEF